MHEVKLPKKLRIISFGSAERFYADEAKRPTPVEACMEWAYKIESRILNEFEHSHERDNVDDAIAALREALRALDAAK